MEAVLSVIVLLHQMPPARQINPECKPGNERWWNLLHKLGCRSAGECGDRSGRELLAIPQGWANGHSPLR